MKIREVSKTHKWEVGIFEIKITNKNFFGKIKIFLKNINYLILFIVII